MTIEFEVAGLMIACIFLGVMFDETIRTVIEWKRGE